MWPNKHEDFLAAVSLGFAGSYQGHLGGGGRYRGWFEEVTSGAAQGFPTPCSAQGSSGDGSHKAVSYLLYYLWGPIPGHAPQETSQGYSGQGELQGRAGRDPGREKEAESGPRKKTRSRSGTQFSLRCQSDSTAGMALALQAAD